MQNNKTLTTLRIKLRENAMTVLQRDTHYHTYADYLTWSRDYGDELINGTAYAREPSGHSPSHQRIVGELGRQAANALEGKPCRVFFVPLKRAARVGALWPLDQSDPSRRQT